MGDFFNGRYQLHHGIVVQGSSELKGAVMFPRKQNRRVWPDPSPPTIDLGGACLCLARLLDATGILLLL